MKILVVDDAIFMRNILKDILTRGGHTIVGEASNGQEAYEKYRLLNPDIVTMDITMPDVNGIQGLKMIREYDNNAKVIMCTAMGQQIMMIEAIKYGSCDFIVKPFTVARVLEAVEKAR